jgi:hypothetical protein
MDLRKDGYSFRSIARELNSLGIKLRRANNWNGWGVSMIVRRQLLMDLDVERGEE